MSGTPQPAPRSPGPARPLQPSVRSDPGRGLRALTGAVALGCAAAAAAAGWHHPVLGPWALLPLLAAAAAAAWAPAAWPAWLLPALPLVGGMPWTGWLVVEEFDLLVLAVAAGGYGRWAVAGPGAAASGATPDAPPRRKTGAWLAAALLACYAAALAASMLRGVADAGGWPAWSAALWWQGYQEPMNALRLAKSLPLALLLLPLWLRGRRVQPQAAGDALAFGMAGMCATAASGVVWERLAHTGLTNFSSDYRATGLFWEMHVGGAALDAALAATLPFALLALLRARSRVAWVLAAAGLLAAGYAALATFSRVVYVALPVGMAVLFGLRALQRRAGAVPAVAADAPRAWSTLALAAGFAVAGLVVFPGSGYRGLLALLGAFALALPAVSAVGAMPGAASARRRVLVAGVVGGLLAAGLVLAVALLVPKGAYVACAAMAAVGAGCLAWRRGVPALPPAPADLPAVGLLAAALGMCAGVAAVAWHWGGGPALPPAAGVAALLAVALCALAASPRPPWPASLRWQAAHTGLLGVLALALGVFSGGAYMGGRWQSLGDDLANRLGHARHALSLLHARGDELLGRGLGRYAATQTMSGDADYRIGDHRWRAADGGGVLLLTSGTHVLGWGQLFRISQRIDEPALPVKARITLRTAQDVELHAEVCEKHLLYNGSCVVGQRMARAQGGRWQTIEWALQGSPPRRGSLLAPRFVVFSFALGTPGSKAEFDRVELLAADGRQLLSNAGFGQGMARWFFTSDHLHMPWHAKNLGLHLRFEQGLAGLVLFALLGAAALWRVTAGRARLDPLAPALAAALVGLAVVGMGDSLLDMPRIGWLLYALLGVALWLRPAQAR